MHSAAEIKEQYQRIEERVRAAEAWAGRDAGSVTIVAVTKSWPVETLLAAHEAGLRHIGENRPEELSEKRAAVEAALGRDNDITWHLIGPLQSRKTRLAAMDADYFHALDRLKIARRLSEQLAEEGRNLPVLLEVNVSGEASKTGFAATDWERDAGQQAALRDVAATVAALPRIELCGLMTMAPWQAPNEVVGAVFRRTAALAEWLQRQSPGLRLPLLSMGMTDDFEPAIAAGATHIRVGRAIFGPRRP